LWTCSEQRTHVDFITNVPTSDVGHTVVDMRPCLDDAVNDWSVGGADLAQSFHFPTLWEPVVIAHSRPTPTHEVAQFSTAGLGTAARSLSADGLDRCPLVVGQDEGLDLLHRCERSGDLVGSHGAVLPICPRPSHRVDFDFRPVR